MSRPDSRRCTFTRLKIAPSLFQQGEALCNDLGEISLVIIIIIRFFRFLFFFCQLSQHGG